MQDQYDGHLSADVLNSPMSNHERAALDAVLADVQAAPATVDTANTMHIAPHRVASENASAAAVACDVASTFGGVVQNRTDRRKAAEADNALYDTDSAKQARAVALSSLAVDAISIRSLVRAGTITPMAAFNRLFDAVRIEAENARKEAR